jgi:predicted DNA-binding protein
MRIKAYNTTMRRTNINLRPDQWTKLKALSEKTGATPSALIRKAIDAYLKRGK